MTYVEVRLPRAVIVRSFIVAAAPSGSCHARRHASTDAAHAPSTSAASDEPPCAAKVTLPRWSSPASSALTPSMSAASMSTLAHASRVARHSRASSTPSIATLPDRDV